MRQRLRVGVQLSEPIVDEIDGSYVRAIFTSTEEKVSWLDVAVDEAMLVNVLDGVKLSEAK